MNDKKSPDCSGSKLDTPKYFYRALAAAALLNAGAVVLYNTQSLPNILWAVGWLYLSARAWGSMNWKALVPYPVFIIAAIVAMQLLKGLEFDTASGKLAANIALNASGLAFFYRLYRKSNIIPDETNDIFYDPTPELPAKLYLPSFPTPAADRRKAPEPRPAGVAGVSPAQPAPSKKALTEEDFWALALAEYEGIDRHPGLWAKFFVECDGSEAKVKARYLKHRSEQLMAEHQPHRMDRKFLSLESGT